MPGVSGWTDDRIGRMKQLWNDGLSAAQIAAALGGVTRSAVIGKVHRIGLHGNARSNVPRIPIVKRKPGNQFGISRKKRLGTITRDPAGVMLVQQFDKAPPPPICLKITLAKLENDSCRFILGEVAGSETIYCGVPEADINDGKPWCRYHHRIAYKPASERARKPSYQLGMA